MNKIRFLLVLYPLLLGAMDPGAKKVVTLSDGTKEYESVVENFNAFIKQLRTDNYAAYLELVKRARDEKVSFSPTTTKLLYDRGFLNAEGKPVAKMRSLIISAAQTSGITPAESGSPAK